MIGPVLAQAAGDAALTGGIVGAVIILARVVEKLVDRFRGTDDKNGAVTFKETDRNLLSRVHEVCTAKDITGRPLCYTSTTLVDHMTLQTSILSRLEDLIRRQVSIIEKRVDVCDEHTEILKHIDRKLEVK